MANPYPIVDADGFVVMHGLVPGSIFSLPVPDGCRMLAMQGAPNCYVQGSVLMPIGEAPSRHHTFDRQAKVWVCVRTLADYRADQLAAVNAAFEAASQALTEGYPASERLTWPIQQAEALAWAADPFVSTPYLDGLAAARGIDAGALVRKTLANVEAWMAASQQLIGRRQALRDAIAAAATVEAIQAITWEGGP